MTPHNASQRPRPFERERSTFSESLVVNGLTIRVGDVLTMGGVNLLITTIRAVHNGRQLVFHTGELLVVKARSEFTIRRHRRPEVRRYEKRHGCGRFVCAPRERVPYGVR
jgi:hypothetical protein